MSDLILYISNHGYMNTDPLYVSWLDGVYYVSDKDQHSFKLATTSGGATLVQFTTTQTSGYVRKIEPSTGTTTITGLDHLNGETVYLTNNGKLVGGYVVSSGQITVPENVYSYQVGLPYTMRVKGTRLELVSAPNTTQKKIKRIMAVGVRYLKSVGGKAGQEIDGTEYTQDLDCEFNTKSKDVEVLNKAGYNPDSYIIVKSEKPYPFTLIATTAILDVTE